MWDVLLSFDPALLATFVLAGLLLNITPGADFVFVTASGIQGGPRTGMAAGLGISLGGAVHIVAAAAGVSALLQTSPFAYDLIRYAGAAYLIYLAWSAWRNAGLLEDANAAAKPMRAIRRGFMTNILNPKTALFIFAFLPQFANPANGPLGPQILMLGAIFLFNGFLFVLILGATAGALANILRPRVRILNKLTAILFGGLAARLLID